MVTRDLLMRELCKVNTPPLPSPSARSRKRCVRYNSCSSFLLINVALFLWGSSTTSIPSEGANGNIMVDAFLQPHPVRRNNFVSNGRRLNTIGRHWSTTKLYSMTSDNQHKVHLSGDGGNSDDDYLLNYPNIRSFNDALQDIASEYSDTRRVKFDVISRAAAAEALVKKLESDPNAPFRPNIVTYNIILKIWSKSAHVLAEGHGRGDINEVFHALDNVPVPDDLMDVVNHISSAKDAAEHCDSILTSLEERYLNGDSHVVPNCYAYNTVMDGWSKSRAKDGPQHIQDLFLKMNKRSSEGVTDNEESLVHTDAKHWKQIGPNRISYSTAIESYKRRTFKNKMGDIEALVNELEQKYEKSENDPNLKPDIGVANAMIKAYMRNADYSSGGGGKFQQSMTGTSWKTAKKVDDIYIQWNKRFKNTGDIDFKPNVITTTMVIDAYSRCGDINATEKAQAIFQSMIKDWQETGDDRLKPSSKTFTAIITAWAKTKDPRSPHKAEELLNLMEEMYADDVKEGRQSQLTPHSQTYTAAITAWSRSLDNSKPQRALKILKKVIDLHKEMKDRRIQPTLFTYNAAIDACAKCYGTPEQQANALKIAFAVNKAISAAKLKANHVTYATLLKAANTLLVSGKEKNEVVKAVFDRCKKEGYVDMTVLKTFKLAADQDLFYEVLECAKDRNGNVDFDLIPSDWSKHIS